MCSKSGWLPRPGGSLSRSSAPHRLMTTNPRRPFPSTSVCAFAAGSVLVAALSWFAIAWERHSAVAHWELRQDVVVQALHDRVSDWLKDRRGDAEVLAANPPVRAALALRTRGEETVSPPEAQRQLVPYLDRVAAAYGYTGIRVFDAQGVAIAQSSASPHLKPPGLEGSGAVARSGDFRVDLLGDVPETKVLSFTLPVLDEGSRAPADDAPAPVMGTVMLMAPARSLFQLVGAETVPTRTGETLLVRREGDDIAFLFPPRHRSGTAADLRLPAGVPDPAVRAALERRSASGEFTDYRGVAVLAATRRIHQTGWGLLRKIDRAEAL